MCGAVVSLTAYRACGGVFSIMLNQPQSLMCRGGLIKSVPWLCRQDERRGAGGGKKRSLGEKRVEPGRRGSNQEQVKGKEEWERTRGAGGGEERRGEEARTEEWRDRGKSLEEREKEHQEFFFGGEELEKTGVEGEERERKQEVRAEWREEEGMRRLG